MDGPAIKFLTMCTLLLSCTVGCAKRPPTMAYKEISKNSYVEHAAKSDYLDYQTFGNAKWTKDLIKVNDLQKQNLFGQLKTDEQKLKQRTDMAHTAELYKEATFQSTIRLEQLRNKNLTRTSTPGNKNKTIATPQITFWGV